MRRQVFSHEQNSSAGNIMFAPDFLILNTQCLTVDKLNYIESEYVLDNNNLNFLCLTETWSNADFLRSIHITQFNLGSFSCRSLYKGGGTAIFYRKELDVNCIDLSEFCIDKHIELCCLRWVTRDSKNETVILNCYRSPSGDINVFLSQLSKVMDYIYSSNANFIVCGDFNMDMLNTNGYSNNLANLMLGYDLHATVKWPTRVCDTTATVLDNIFTDIPPSTSICGVFDNNISDHRTVLYHSNLSAEAVDAGHGSQYRRRFSEQNIANFEYEFSQVNWTPYTEAHCIETAFNDFYDTFMFYFNKNFPKSKCSNAPCILSRKWVTDEVRRSSSSLKDLFALQSRFPVLRPVYRERRQIHLDLLTKTKRAHYQRTIIDSVNPSRASWQLISSLSGRNESPRNIEVGVDGVLTTNPLEVADSFNDFFIQSAAEIVGAVPQVSTTFPQSATVSQSMFLEPFTINELSNLMRSKIKNKFSSGVDEVPAFLLRRLSGVLVYPLHLLINLSFRTGQFHKIEDQ